MRILIVEDEFKLADVIACRLKKENFIVDIATDGKEGLDEALSGIYDLIILDVMLPKMDGFSVLKTIRLESITSKVILLTAKSMISDKLNGFDNGANDYLTKPFSMDELIARVKACLNINQNIANKDCICYKDIKLNTKSAILTCTSTNDDIEVVCKEFLLIEYLIRNQNQIVSKEQIYNKVWGMYNESESNNLEAYLSFLRKKLKIIGSNVQIKSIRGLGYKLEYTK